jgi:hypothetical protein
LSGSSIGDLNQLTFDRQRPLVLAQLTTNRVFAGSFAGGKRFAEARDWRTEMALQPSRTRKNPAKLRLRAQHN